MSHILNGKTVLVTGGAGSIGGALVTESLAAGAKAVRVLDSNEYGVFGLGERYGHDERLRLLVGDVRDRSRMQRACQGVDIVFHAAALKHVPLCEYNPFEAMQTNVVGTQNCIDAALATGVERFVFISTDKAVLPVNTMGATKLLAERLVVEAQNYGGDSQTRFGCVRFGNVLGSRGSVVETFAQQLASSKPITITDHRMTRFVMRIRDATALIGHATDMMRGGEIFILRMPAVKIGDLADGVRLHAGVKASTARPVIIGKRPGEKLHELLMTEEEATSAATTDQLHIVMPQGASPASYGAKAAVPHSYSSADGPFLPPAEIARLLVPST